MGTPESRQANRSLTRSLLLMVAGSFAFGFALVPLYDVISEAAGIRVNDAPSSIQASDQGAGREVTLEFVSMLPDGSAFELTPATRSMKLQPGALDDLSPPWHLKALYLVVLLRLAVLLHRGRGPRSLPEIRIAARGKSAELTFPRGWLGDHPLTLVDLEQEAEYLAAVGFRLKAS
jgi:hypothetical protein